MEKRSENLILLFVFVLILVSAFVLSASTENLEELGNNGIEVYGEKFGILNFFIILCVIFLVFLVILRLLNYFFNKKVFRISY